ncbi:MAG: hypothetical protein ACJATU_000621 [Rickettsiales bacterium]
MFSYIEEYVDGEQSLSDHKTYDAVLRQLQIMSESTQKLSDSVKLQFPQIKWREIAGFRNILVHDYLGDIDFKIIWKVIENKLPELKFSMQQLITKK